MEPQQLLDDAAKLIEEAGWIKGQFRNRDGYCMVGAISTVYTLYCSANETMDYNEETTLWINAIDIAKKRVNGQDAGSLTHWNDSPKRTKEEVIAVLRGN